MNVPLTPNIGITGQGDSLTADHVRQIDIVVIDFIDVFQSGASVQRYRRPQGRVNKQWD